jgi:hypothetical protein
MSEHKSNFPEMKTIPTGLRVVAVLLLIDGLLALFGCLFSEGQALERLYGAIGCIVLITTSILILLNHKMALLFSFLCAVLLTIDATSQFVSLHTLSSSAHGVWQAARTLFNIALYWVVFLWFREWRRTTTE